MRQFLEAGMLPVLFARFPPGMEDNLALSGTHAHVNERAGTRA